LRIKVIVPAATSIWNEKVREAYEATKDLGTQITIINLEKGPESIEQHYDVAWAEFFALQEIQRAEEEGYDAVISYCFDDPALLAAKEKLRIPVVGLQEPSIHLAAILGRKFSVVGVGGERGIGAAEDEIRRYRLEGSLASIRLADILVLDIDRDREKLWSALSAEARKAVEEDGADVIVLGCGALLGLAQQLQKELGVPVIDPGLVALKVAEDLVKLTLAQSKKAFPFPNPKRRYM
jgi:allantoin racemase